MLHWILLREAHTLHTGWLPAADHVEWSNVCITRSTSTFVTMPHVLGVCTKKRWLSQSDVQHVVVYIRRQGYLRTRVDDMLQPIARQSTSIEYGALCPAYQTSCHSHAEVQPNPTDICNGKLLQAFSFCGCGKEVLHHCSNE